MKIYNIKVYGFYNAMLGMRFPKNSDNLFDSSDTFIGKNDLKLLLSLTKAGRDHRKALRMLHVSAIARMPISWWIQYDTYKVATTANSRSRMHKMGSTILTKEDFYIEEWDDWNNKLLEYINNLIISWQNTKDTNTWRKIIDILPMSYCQERMLDLNYETLITIFSSRYNEKLKNEWRYFCDEFLKQCPNLKEIWEASK